MPRRGPSEADLYLLYGFASALVFLMGIIIVMRSRGRRMYDVEARGVVLRAVGEAVHRMEEAVDVLQR